MGADGGPPPAPAGKKKSITTFQGVVISGEARGDAAAPGLRLIRTRLMRRTVPQQRPRGMPSRPPLGATHGHRCALLAVGDSILVNPDTPEGLPYVSRAARLRAGLAPSDVQRAFRCTASAAAGAQTAAADAVAEE